MQTFPHMHLRHAVEISGSAMRLTLGTCIKVCRIRAPFVYIPKSFAFSEEKGGKLIFQIGVITVAHTILANQTL